MPQFQTFKDLNVTFKSHPITGDLTTVKNESAIKQSILNLLLTNQGERLFNTRIGSNLSSLIFEQLDYGVASLVRSEILNTLERFEPRINILELSVNPDFDNNGFTVELQFEIIGREDIPLNVAFFLERTR